MNEKKVSIKEIAKLAGVGVGTVSRVLNNRYGVKPETRQMVRRIMEDMGYKPDELARSLRTGRTQTILVFISDISNPSYSPIAKGIQHVLDERDYRFVLYDTSYHDVDKQMVQALARIQADGVIVCVSTEELPHTAKYIRKMNLPTLAIDREPADLDISRIYTNYYDGFAQATEHLIRLGHRQIGLIAGYPTIRPARESIRGFTETMADKLGSEPSAHVETGPYDRGFSGVVMERWMKSAAAERPTAVIVSNYEATIGVLEWCRANQWQFPGDISLIAFEDVDLFRFFHPAITVISRPLYDLGKQAGRMIIDAVEARQQEPSGMKVSSICTIATELVARDSCGPI